MLSQYGKQAVETGIDGNAVSASSDDFRGTIPQMYIGYGILETPLPVCWWRAVGHSSRDLALGSFIDELVAAGGKDHVEIRRHH